MKFYSLHWIGSGAIPGPRLGFSILINLDLDLGLRGASFDPSFESEIGVSLTGVSLEGTGGLVEVVDVEALPVVEVAIGTGHEERGVESFEIGAGAEISRTLLVEVEASGLTSCPSLLVNSEPLVLLSSLIRGVLKSEANNPPF